MQSASGSGFRKPRVWWWFLVPLLTFGFATFVMVAVGGVYRRSRMHLAAAGGYFALTVLFLAGSQETGAGSDTYVLPDAVTVPALLIIWFGGTAHVALLQTRIRAQAPVSTTPAPVVDGADPALAAAQWRGQRRQEARALAVTNPGLAAELRIGRPDLPGRQYDDGGLVDVNHVPGDWLAGELDLPADVVAKIVSERDRLGGFTIPEELLVYCERMSAERLEIVRDRLIFIAM